MYATRLILQAVYVIVKIAPLPLSKLRLAQAHLMADGCIADRQKLYKTSPNMMDRDAFPAADALESRPFQPHTQKDHSFHALFDQSSQLIWLLSPDGMLLDANQTALDFGNTDYEHIVGRPLAAVMGWTFPNQGQERLQAAIASAADGETIRYEANIQGAESEAVLDLTVRPTGRATQPPRLVVEGVDVSDRKRLESHLHRCQRLESVDELIAGVVHSLDDLLSPVLGVSSLLRLDFPVADSHQHKLVSVLSANTQRAIALAKQTLQFVREDTEKHQAIEVDHLLMSVKQLIYLTLPPSVSMFVEVPAGIWPIAGRESQLQQVLMNLCLNARDAMPNGGHLELLVENIEIDSTHHGVDLEDSPQDYVVIRVSDTGSGISPQVLDRIFEPFFTTKSASRSTGLGLSTAQDIVESHGGFIDVLSTPNLGSQFLVFLPALI